MDGEGLRVRGLPLGWEWCVSAVSDSLVSSVLRAARVPKCRSQGSELWIKGRGRGLSIWVPFLFEQFREERTRADGRRRPAGPRPPSWVGMVRVCSVGLSCVLCSARGPGTEMQKPR